MRQRRARETIPLELTTAIGLVWGFLRVNQFEDAYRLARGCLAIWPQDERLLLMAASAAVELLEPLDEQMQRVLESAECAEWTQVVRWRASVASS